MRYFSQQELEYISRRVYKAYSNTVGFSEKPECVIPEQLAELMHLSFDYRHLSRDRLTLGLTSFDDAGVEVFDSPDEEMYFLDGKTMLIEEDLQVDQNKIGRCNFTKTHEVCHHILHFLYPVDFSDSIVPRTILLYRIERRSIDQHLLHERIVDRLASTILMPEALVRQNMELCGIPEKIDVLNRLWRKEGYQKFSDMADLMGVSKQALCFRLKTLGLLGKEYLSNPYEQLNIYMDGDECG